MDGIGLEPTNKNKNQVRLERFLEKNYWESS